MVSGRKTKSEKGRTLTLTQQVWDKTGIVRAAHRLLSQQRALCTLLRRKAMVARGKLAARERRAPYTLLRSKVMLSVSRQMCAIPGSITTAAASAVLVRSEAYIGACGCAGYWCGWGCVALGVVVRRDGIGGGKWNDTPPCNATMPCPPSLVAKE
jgi:hypothetical protein